MAASNTVAAKIEELLALPVDTGDWPLFAKTYAALLKAQRDEPASIAMLATKMRIAQQSTYDKSKRKPARGLSFRGHQQERKSPLDRGAVADCDNPFEPQHGCSV